MNQVPVLSLPATGCPSRAASGLLPCPWPLQALRWLGVSLVVFGCGFLQSLRLCLPSKIQSTITYSINIFSNRLLLWVLGISLAMEGKQPKAFGIVVANHTSWLDPCALSSLLPLGWITSNDVARHPFLGAVTRLTGCLFVSRQIKSLPKEIQQMHSIAQRGVMPAFFPEATTGDGRQLLPFHAAFFEVPLRTKLPIYPICLQWRGNDGKPLSYPQSDIVHWYGDMTFGPHLKGLIQTRGLQLSVRFLEPVDSSQYTSRKALAQEVEARILKHTLFQ